MKTLISLVIVGLLSSFSIINIVNNDDDCKILHEGKFYYLTNDDSVIVKINGNDHIEYLNHGKYYIKSKLNWVNNCEYYMTMEEITLPNFPYGPGDIMNVRILKIEKNEIFYISSVKGQSWNGKLVKIE